MQTVVAALGAVLVLATAQAAPLSSVMAKLDEYLAGYEPQLSALIADEAMVQEVQRSGNDLRRRDSDGLPIARRQRRRLTSEVAFIALPDQAGWLGFRHVKKVDNRAVEDVGASLASALGTPGYDAARRLLAASAEHNLGLPRTINLPNLPLEFLHLRNRPRLVPRLDGRERVNGIDAVRVLFIERMTPTLIRNPNGDDMPSLVRAWVDPKTGSLLRAEVSTFRSADARQVQSRIRVDFRRNKELNLLVPIEMRESFPVPPPGSGTSVASYTNFRRFQTSARIVPQ